VLATAKLEDCTPFVLLWGHLGLLFQRARSSAHLSIFGEAKLAGLRVRLTMSFNIENGVADNKCMSMFLQ